ncbi:type II toxin-antitoxin system VapC family toxin [Jiella pacifica]|uniref:PIN domain-containing protein n=1 Tax=Jiella pacifica TaxID=2696469 RepID=A0A6N9T8S7_9HYPH|nr:type II toxin-antitoxin system VapC family toxin [Jiella pacifica]NDW07823.1 PIN domain-containing protein [Jiella pacifica]
MSLVLDSSATLAWVYGDERTAAIDAVFKQVIEAGAWVPQLWHLEVANSLTVAVRRNRIKREFRDGVLADLAELDIAIDSETEQHAWSATLQLADAHSLSVYDASYLELAQRRRLPLATLDEALRRAAQSASVRVLP